MSMSSLTMYRLSFAAVTTCCAVPPLTEVYFGNPKPDRSTLKTVDVNPKQVANSSGITFEADLTKDDFGEIQSLIVKNVSDQPYKVTFYARQVHTAKLINIADVIVDSRASGTVNFDETLSPFAIMVRVSRKVAGEWRAIVIGDLNQVLERTRVKK